MSTFKALALFPLLMILSVFEARGGDDAPPARLSALAHNGDVGAQLKLGLFLRNGFGRTKDNELAFEWFTKAMAAGDPIASYLVGAYYSGRPAGVVAPDPKKAMELKLVAATAGLANAQHEVAVQYLQDGKLTEAVTNLEKAAKQGFAPAMQALSVWYHDGKSGAKDPVLSVAYLQLAKAKFTGDQRARVDSQAKQWAAALSTSEKRSVRAFVAGFKATPSPLTRKAKLLLEPVRMTAGSPK